MRRPLAILAGAALVGTIGFTAPAVAAPRALAVTAVFVGAQCQGGDFANVRLTAVAEGATGEVRFKWDWTNNGSYDTRSLANPQVHHLYGDELIVTARVGARDATGATAQDTIQFNTPRCG